MEEAEKLRAELEAKQTEATELTRVKEDLDLALANSPLKQQASNSSDNLGLFD